MERTEAAAGEQQWRAFRQEREAALAGRHGWLTLTGFMWLPGSPAVVDGLPGLWSADGDQAVLTAGDSGSLQLVESGLPARGTLTASLADEESLLWVRFGGSAGDRVVVELARRAGHYAVRPRDAQSPVLTGFTGVPTYGYRPDWVVEGRFEPYPEPVDVPIRTARSDVPGVHRSVGEVCFRVPGGSAEYRLQVSAGAGGSLSLTFHDATNGRQTAGWRSLGIPAPAADGTVLLDFNRGINYPSAFTAFGTCPMPVAGNRIDVPVTAGEKQPEVR